MKNSKPSGPDFEGLNKELFNPLLFQEILSGNVPSYDADEEEKYELTGFDLPIDELSLSEFIALEDDVSSLIPQQTEMNVKRKSHLIACERTFTHAA